MPSDQSLHRPSLSARTEAPLAPCWHTSALVALILVVAVTGSVLAALSNTSSPAPPSVLPAAQRLLTVYLPLLVVNAVLVLYVSRLFRTRSVLPELLGRRWRGVGRAVIDLVLAALGVLLISWLESRLALGPAGRNAALRRMLPSTVAERLTWVLVSAGVGFCEEVVYRGYLQRQLSAASGRALFGILLQGTLFGIAHLEQGPAAALRIAGYGVLLGVLARVRRSLWPGIACHIGIDLRSVFF